MEIDNQEVFAACQIRKSSQKTFFDRFQMQKRSAMDVAIDFRTWKSSEMCIKTISEFGNDTKDKGRSISEFGNHPKSDLCTISEFRGRQNPFGIPFPHFLVGNITPDRHFQKIRRCMRNFHLTGETGSCCIVLRFHFS